MRLNRLDLLRYGRFQDAQIVLPPHADGSADVTVVFGANEAGKSTAFNGFLELLFGMKARDHPYAFRFDRNDLLVGAELDLPGRGAMVLRRNGKRTQSLLDEHDQPIDEAILTSALHGVTRDAYVERFSLNDQGLREGGAKIAGAQGDLGQLLHAGVSGLTNTAAILDGLAAQADQFHKKGGRATTLKQAKDRLAEIAQEMRAGSLTPEKERKLDKARKDATAVFEDADDALQLARKRQAAGTAAQTWFYLTAEIDRLQADLAAYPDGPDMPNGAAAQVAALVTAIDGNRARVAEAVAKIARHDQTIADNPEDPSAAALSVELAQLDQMTLDGAPLTARATTAASDLARRIDERDDLARQIADVLKALAADNADLLVLQEDQLEALAVAAQASLSAATAHKTAQDQVAHAKAQLGDAPPEPQDLSALKSAWDAWQQVTDIAEPESRLTAQEAQLAKAVAGLPANWLALVDAGLPARETLDQVAQAWGQITADLAAATADLATRQAEDQTAQAAYLADQNAPAAVDVAAIEDTRRTRDVLWAAHCAALSEATGAAFADAMYADDAARANFLTGATARERLEASRTQAAKTQGRREQTQTRVNELTAQHDAMVKQATDLVQALGFDAGTPPAAFATRHATLITAAETAAEVASARVALEKRVAQRDAALADLTAAAGSVQISEDILARVPAALTLQGAVQEKWDAWKAAGLDIARLDKIATDAAEQEAQAAAHLATLTAALPLADRTATAVMAALPDLRKLQLVHKDCVEMCARVEALEAAVAGLSASAAQMSAIMGESKDDPMQVIATVRARVTAAEKARATLARETASRAEEIAQQERAAAEIAAAEGALTACFAGQGGDDLAPLDRMARLAERDELRRKSTEADDKRQAARAAVDAELFDAELALLPDSAREAEIAQAMDDAQGTRDAARDARNEAARLYDEAYAADDQSALATEKATLLEDLREGARRAAIARIGVLAARNALRSLAAERRTTMLRDVEEAFVTMTAPAWTGVDVWSQTEGEKLVGVQPGGAHVPVEMMSTGTMGQLYFALRLAGYRGFARDPGPLPMVLDDIMETFDDARAAAALKLCAEIGQSGQAIIFTHHAHLVDLARTHIPGVNVVEMPA